MVEPAEFQLKSQPFSEPMKYLKQTSYMQYTENVTSYNTNRMERESFLIV